MYAQTRQVRERQRDLLSRAYRERRAAQAQSYRRASRRAERAERRLTEALLDMLQARGELTAGS
jgi:hypothetical protein